jgi:hypothetical protein
MESKSRRWMNDASSGEKSRGIRLWITLSGRFRVVVKIASDCNECPPLISSN